MVKCYISIYDDRELISPGAMFDGTQIQDRKPSGVCRNPVTADVILRYVDYMKMRTWLRKMRVVEAFTSAR